MTTSKNIDPKVIVQAAELLRGAAESGKPVAPVRDLISAGGLDAAYAVQEVNTRHYLDSGRRLVGRKIGLTSIAVQRQLGVDQPDYGMLFADMDVPEGIPISLDQVIQPKVEAEIAIVIGRDLPHPDLTTAEMIRAVEYVVPAIEVVDSRVANWDIRIWDTVADNASSGLFVLGAVPRKLDGLDLRECGMVMESKGEPISVGAGIACLGSPITASLWLARVMAQVGRPLLEGDVILSGALGPMAGVSRGDVVEARINGVGMVRAAFAAEAG
ncbi:fumarylacetoacetate hydrolase family protein [Novosphingobium sp. Gsoil 351]|uniref:fumarylacetoacetate hydrolase family protein n=1 Tax=Novosphingobium sp. Gsoil 351 TaxID=2675225 RepID=UPI0012B448F6|nr:fumarylacetoacetate hydrolase family protein [Novosphingobium sp. Gsoil 351]QGN54008.1 2-keto-4-pentenoate hydratase [Novosphingobium sp. Gsoil 351]